MESNLSEKCIVVVFVRATASSMKNRHQAWHGWLVGDLTPHAKFGAVAQCPYGGQGYICLFFVTPVGPTFFTFLACSPAQIAPFDRFSRLMPQKTCFRVICLFAMCEKNLFPLFFAKKLRKNCIAGIGKIGKHRSAITQFLQKRVPWCLHVEWGFLPWRIEWCGRHLCHMTGSDHAHKVSLFTLNRRRVVAPSMLTDPSQHSKHQKGRSCARDNLLRPAFSRTTWLSVVTWLRDVWLGGQEQPDPYAWRGQRECLLRLIASFMDSSCERVEWSQSRHWARIRLYTSENGEKWLVRRVLMPAVLFCSESNFITQCKGNISRAFKTAKVIMFDPMLCKSPDLSLQDELLCWTFLVGLYGE